MPLSRITLQNFTVEEKVWIKRYVPAETLRTLRMPEMTIRDIWLTISVGIIPRYPRFFEFSNEIRNVIPNPDRLEGRNRRTFPLDLEADRLRNIFGQPIDPEEFVEVPREEVPTTPIQKKVNKEPINPLVKEHGYRDLSHYYSGCICFYKDKVILCSDFRQRDNDDVLIHYRTIDNGLLSGYQEDLFTESFSFPLPKTGYINLPKFCMFSERSYKKDNSTKYKKGFCYNHLTYASVSHNEVSLSKLPNPFSTYDLPLQDLFVKIGPCALNKEYPTFEEALNKVTSFEMLSCAFTSSMCVKLDAMYNRFVLLKNTWVIGEYLPTTNKFKMFTSIFNNDLRNLNIDYEDAT